MTRTSRSRQQGISLFIVMVVLLLSMLLVLWSSRTALFNELLTSTDSDYQRALEAAQAMVRDAEFDIQGQKPDGSACSGSFCRAPVIDASQGQAFYPENASDLHDLDAALAARNPSCAAGICTATNFAADFWTTAAALNAMKASAATYGQYTGAQTGDIGNPLLRAHTGTAAKAWYWVEVLPYDIASAISAGPAQAFAPDSTQPSIYRITAIAQGLKPGTQAVLQSVFVWKKVSS
jgi:type IV pilus assembly protein PilX